MSQYRQDAGHYQPYPYEDSSSRGNEAGYGQAPTAYPPYPYELDPYTSTVNHHHYSFPTPYVSQKSRLAAGLLAIFLGSLGVHNFYLGRPGRAVLQLLLTLLTLGMLAPLVAIWALVEGILILVASPGFTTDGRGTPLRD